MDLIKVDIVRLQTTKGFLHLLHDVMAAYPLVVRALAYHPAKFRGEDDVMPPAVFLQRIPDDLLAAPFSLTPFAN